LTALSAEFTIGEGELMAHDVPLGCAPDEYDDLISGTCSHLPFTLTSASLSLAPVLSVLAIIFEGVTSLPQCLHFTASEFINSAQ
ncbi:hypothetical protein, partial [Klebsiella quasipneumoniae]|uniref:hypothetical protein n=1 Tax=Klebsiella quasipneumoniae TaxID=1463165 RepID=UPI001D0D8300